MNLLRPRDRFLTVKGLRLHLLDWGGDGRRSLLLLHGFTGHAHAWDTLSIALQPHFHVYALDQRGHGDSDPADTYNAVAELAELSGVVDQLGLTSLVLVGLSMGGRNAMYFAAQRPELVQKLVVVDIGPEVSRRAAAPPAGPPEPDTWESIEQAARHLHRGNPYPGIHYYRWVASHSLRQRPDGALVWGWHPSIKERRTQADATTNPTIAAQPTGHGCRAHQRRGARIVADSRTLSLGASSRRYWPRAGMRVDLVIRNGRVVTPGGVIAGGVAVDGEIVVTIGPDAALPAARRTLDARTQYVLPGLIDAHVHMASEEDGSIEEGLAQNMPIETDGALHGGVTTFAHFVGQRNEPLLPNIRTTIREGNRWSHVDFFLHAIMSTEGHFEEQAEVYRLGVTSFKHFFNAYKPRPTEGLAWLGGPSDSGMLFRSLQFCARQGAPAIVIVHCEDIDVIAVIEEGLRRAGRNDLGAWSEARPNVAEATRVHTAIELAKAAGAPVYIAHLSAAEAAHLVAAARRDGWPVWAEVTPHHLTHTGDMEAEIGCWGKVNPPLRARKDCERLWRALHDGGVTCLGSDHGTGGRTQATKQGGGGQHGNIWAARSGNRGGLEHFLPVMMTFGVNTGRISIEDLGRVGATNTAKVFGLYPKKGALIPGADADIVLVDPERDGTVDDRFYHCLCEVSVYQGWRFRGMATTTIVRGRVMMEDGETVGEPGWGRYVPRGPAAAGGGG